MRNFAFILLLGCGPSIAPPNVASLCIAVVECGIEAPDCAGCLEAKAEEINASGESLETCESLAAAISLCD
jgi:hypothetical protein